MGFRDRKRSFRKSASNDKYLRLTGLWPSKNKDILWTGRMKAEQLEDLLKQVEEAVEAGAPLVFSLWENEKKESRRDPDFNLQSFVGDSEEKPARRSSRRDRDEEDEEENDEEEEEADEEEGEDEEDEEEEKPRRSSKTSKKSTRGKAKKTSSREKW